MGVSDKGPDEVKPALTNFDLCATSNGLIAAGETRRFKCGKRGRFVIVQLRYKQYLTMAEVQVYAGNNNNSADTCSERVICLLSVEKRTVDACSSLGHECYSCPNAGDVRTNFDPNSMSSPRLLCIKQKSSKVTSHQQYSLQVSKSLY